VTKQRPVGVTILGILALLGAIAAGIQTLQLLHLWPISLTGPVTDQTFRFFTFDLGGALLWGVMALVYLWVFRLLWAVDERGWLFMSILSVLNLMLAIVSIVGQTAWQDMLWAIVANGLVFLYCVLPGTRKSFGID
jgi:hypothetical protein